MDKQTDIEKEDWWNYLPEKIKNEVNESIDQTNRGEFIYLDDLKREVNELLLKK